MRVFVTGAAGWIGSALVPELIGAGHEVTGLARTDASAAALTEAGVRVHRGDLDDPGGLRGAAGASDGVIHLAFNVGMVRSGDFQGAVDADRRAVEMDSAGAAQTNPAAKFRTFQFNLVAQDPQQRRIAVDIDRVLAAIDLKRELHDRPRSFF